MYRPSYRRTGAKTKVKLVGGPYDKKSILTTQTGAGSLIFNVISNGIVWSGSYESQPGKESHWVWKEKPKPFYYPEPTTETENKINEMVRRTAMSNIYHVRNTKELEPYYSHHLGRIKAENLINKEHIAGELAARDQQIAVLQAQIAHLTFHKPGYGDFTSGGGTCV